LKGILKDRKEEEEVKINKTSDEEDEWEESKMDIDSSPIVTGAIAVATSQVFDQF
jgi:hypothetical protein